LNILSNLRKLHLHTTDLMLANHAQLTMGKSHQYKSMRWEWGY